MYKPTVTLMKITTTVSLITSLRVGHLTFLSSSYVSRKNFTGVVIFSDCGTCSILANSRGDVKGREDECRNFMIMSYYS